MKIALVSTAYYPDKIGGREVYVMELHKWLKQKGHEVKVLTRFWHRKVQNEDVIQIITPKGEASGYFYFALKACYFLTINPFNIIHGHDLEGEIACLFTHLLSGKRYILTEHSSVDLGADYFEAWQHRLSFWLKKRALMEAEKVIVPSKSGSDYLIKTFPEVEIARSVVIPHGIDLRKFSLGSRKNDAKSKYNLKDKRIILYFGRVSPEKGIEDLIKAYKIIKRQGFNDVALVIAGSKYTSSFRELLMRKHPDIIFLGEIPHAKAPDVYNIADIYCIYSIPERETFGLTVLEAMASGLPIICSDIPIFREVTKGNAIFVPPSDPLKLALTIKQLLEDSQMMEKLGKNGRRIAEQYYSWENTFKQTERVYREYHLK